MTTAVQLLLHSFDVLSETEKREIISEILHRAEHLDTPPLSDEDLALSAETLFLELDRREARLEQP